MSKESQVMVKALDLTKVFGTGRAEVRAVDHVSLEISKSELVLIMGPSGSGKTTLLSMIGGLLRPTSGNVFVNGIELTALSEARLPEIRARDVGFIFQAFNLLTSLSVEENILFPAGLVSDSKKEARRRAVDLMERFGLNERRRHLPRELSGGEKQRVAIARALVNNPPLILADEPTGNLDSKSGHQVMMALYDIAKDDGRTVVIVTHNPQLEQVADRVLWLEDGKLRDRKDESHEWARDPVCGMSVDKWTTTFIIKLRDSTYYFCSQRCHERFSQSPESYVAVSVGHDSSRE